MNSLQFSLLPTIFATVVFIIGAISSIISKPNYYVLKTIFFIGLAVTTLGFANPYFQDMIYEETTIIVAEYETFHRNGKNLDPTVIFVGENCQYELRVPKYSGDLANLKEGKVYEVEFFNNSKLIKSYRLIE
jgi:hypothetical protein